VHISTPSRKQWRKIGAEGVHVIGYKRGEHTKYFHVGDPWVYDMIAHNKNPNGFIKSVFGVLIKGPSDAVKRRIVQTLPFAIFNFFVRDWTHAFTTNERLDLKSLIVGYHAAVGLVNDALGRNKPEGISSMKTWLNAGYEQNQPAARNVAESFRQMLAEGLGVKGWGDMAWPERLLHLPGQITEGLLKPVDLANWGSFGRAASRYSETIPRRQFYREEIAAGESQEVAQYAHDTRSGNFTESSVNAEMAEFMRSMFFMNPSMQIAWGGGSRLFHPSRAVQRQMWLVRMPILTGVGMLLTATAWQLMDDEDKEALAERKDEDRYRAFSAFGMRFPYPGGFAGAFLSIGAILMEHVLQKDPVQADDLAMSTIEKIFSGISPGDHLPPLLKTPIELKANYKFFYNSQIVPNYLQMAYPHSPELQYFPNTPQIYKDLGDGLDVSPIKVQYAVQQMLSRVMDDLVRGYDRLATGTPYEQAADLPYIGRMFLREPRGFQSQSVLTLSEIDYAYTAMKNQVEAMQKDEDAGETVDAEELKRFQAQLDLTAPYHDAMTNVMRSYKQVKDERAAANPDIKKIAEMERDMTREAKWMLDDISARQNISPEELTEPLD
jgi:hypothetical protein